RARSAVSEQAGAKRREGTRARYLSIDQELQVRVEAVDVRRAFTLDEIEHLVGIERVHEDLPVAGQHRAQWPFDVPEDVKEREVVHEDVALRGLEATVAVGQVREQQVITHHTLRESGRP